MPTMSRTVIGVIGALVIPASLALALGFELGQAKDELKLKYDVSVYDHDTGRVTVTFRLADEGRLKPINSIDLSIPSKAQNWRSYDKPPCVCQNGVQSEKCNNGSARSIQIDTDCS